MNGIDLKTKVAAAVAVRWDEFAVRHPALAAVIDQTLLVETAADALANDPEYQEALATARAIEASVDTLVSIVDRYVVKFIGRLVD